jgi:hypothetical protein
MAITDLLERVMKGARPVVLFLAFWLAGGPAVAAAPRMDGNRSAGLEAISLVPKPVDRAINRLAHRQPALPAGVKEVPYVETTPEPALTDGEKQRGYMLFGRPTVEPVYPNTRPRPDERLEALVAFAAPGQFEPVTLALYPIRPLVSLKVRVSPLSSPAGQIPADLRS